MVPSSIPELSTLAQETQKAIKLGPPGAGFSIWIPHQAFSHAPYQHADRADRIDDEDRQAQTQGTMLILWARWTTLETLHGVAG